MKDRRIGRFYIDALLLQSRPEEAKKVLQGVLIVRAEQRWDMDAIEYVGIHESFDELERGQIAPLYEVRLEKKEIRVSPEEFSIQVTFKGFERVRS